MDTSLTLQRLSIRRGTDDAVFDRALAGDPMAFSEVYRRYQKRVYGYCLARLMDPHAAADATQDVFLRLLNTSTDHVDNPLAWIFSVARTVTTDAMRKRTRTPDADEIDPDAGDGALASADTATELLGREDARNVFLALRRLRPRYRTALILRELHHQSSADMAAALETSTGAVDTLVSRARDAFGRTYADVVDLPDACKSSVAWIYKRQGTGLDDAEEARLQAHTSGCPRCRAEAAKAARPETMAALLPFLVPSKGLNIFERALLAVRGIGDNGTRLSTVLPGGHWTPAAKTAAAVITAILVTAPIAATVGRAPSIPAAAHAVRPATASVSAGTSKTAASAKSWGCAPSSELMRKEQMQYNQWRAARCTTGSTSTSWSGSSTWTSTSKSASWTSGNGSQSRSYSGSGRTTSSSGSRTGSWSGSSSGTSRSSSGGSSGSWSGSSRSGMSSGGSRSSGSPSGW